MTAPLVVFGEDWGRHPSSTQHLVRGLAASRDVIWVNSIGLRRPRLTLTDFGRLLRKSHGATARTEPSPSRMTVLAPRAVPWPGHPLARRINRAALGRQLRAALERRGLERPILWTSLPTAVDVIGTLGERAVVYYCGDDFSALAGVDHAAVTGLECELAERADLIVAASPRLAAKFDPRKTRLVPHGVDLALFGADPPRPHDLPCGRPVAGFYGSIAEWVDIPLLAEVARRLVDWHLVLIGAVQTDIAPLAGLPNVHLLGPRPHHALPAYVCNWAASLLPFRRTAQIDACNPLKLREYMAAARPIISTDFPALDGYRDLLRIAGTPEAFAQAVAAAVAENTGMAAARRERVAGESWDIRIGTVATLLGELE